MNEKRQISSIAPFFSSLVFFGLAFWTLQSSIFQEPTSRSLGFFIVATYCVLGIAAAGVGAYLQVTGKKTVEAPRKSYMVISMIAVVVVAAIGAAAVWYSVPAV